VVALGTARGSFLRRWRLLAIDGFDIDVPDTRLDARPGTPNMLPAGTR
jgi:hypothetical protein